ncbi:MAG: hypothetical protein ACE363_12320 [Alphaproteobacteria bacterium]
MKQDIGAVLGADAALLRQGQVVQATGFKNSYTIECIRDGALVWREAVDNLVVSEGLDEILDKFWRGSAYSASHHVGLADGTPTGAAGDTMASHPGWTEITAFTEGARPALTLGTVSGQSVDNSAAKASFTINASATVGGAFVATDAAKGGTTGTLIGIAAFSGGDRAVQSGDTVNVTVTLTAQTA